MFNLVLFEPEIPPNTGNIIRLCANTNAQLHIIEPMGFSVDEKKLIRAGLDHYEWNKVKIWRNFLHFKTELPNACLIAASTKGIKNHTSITYSPNDFIIFGPETRGLPQNILEQCNEIVKIPIITTSRSLNLSNSVAIILYEALRQQSFPSLS